MPKFISSSCLSCSHVDPIVMLIPWSCSSYAHVISCPCSSCSCSHIHDIPMFTSFLCLSHSYVYPVLMFTPCLCWSHVNIHPMHMFIPCSYPPVKKLIYRHYLKIPYHTSILSGRAWVQELIHGHPECIQTELRVHAHVFKTLIFELTQMGYSDLKNVTLEEQLAIYLYTSITGLTTRPVGERFQWSNETISKLVNWHSNWS